MFEALGPFPVVAKVGGRDVRVEVSPERRAPDYELIGLRIRQSPEKRGLDDAEHGEARPNTEGQGKPRDKREHRGLEQRAEREPDVLEPRTGRQDPARADGTPPRSKCQHLAPIPTPSLGHSGLLDPQPEEFLQPRKCLTGADGPLSANLGETRNEQRIRVGRRQRDRGC